MPPYAFTPPRPFLVCVLLVLGAGLAGCGAGGEAQQQRRAPPPVPVAVQTVEPGVVDVYATYPGRITGKREVEVRSRIEGILIESHYNEGEFVDKGEALLTIDPREFVARVNQRKAQLAQAEAELSQAQQIWDRVSRLYEVNAISEAERDKARAGLETAQAAVKLAQANLESAQIKLSYTKIEAPLSGVTSLQEIDEGALVTPGTLLTTVTQLDPVHVLFSVPAEDALMRKKALAAMVEGDGETRNATLMLPSGKVYPQPGVVDFTQSTIDPSTGTVRLRAVFDNNEHLLVPGRFVRVRIRLETRDNTVVVPNKAIADQEQTAMVYVVTDDNKAKTLPVELGPAVDGGRIIEQGLEPGDRVITIGLGAVSPGAAVKVVPPEKVALGGDRPGKDTGQPAAASKQRPNAKPQQDDASTPASGSSGKQGN